MANRKWKEIKLQTSMLPAPAVPGSCLASFHFRWAIHPIRPVYKVLLNRETGLDCSWNGRGGRVVDKRQRKFPCAKFRRSGKRAPLKNSADWRDGWVKRLRDRLVLIILLEHGSLEQVLVSYYPRKLKTLSSFLGVRSLFT